MSVFEQLSILVSDQFIDTISEIYFLLETNPFFSIRYKSYHAISVSKFPYLLFFEIDEDNKIVYILSCFHTSKNPKKYPI